MCDGLLSFALQAHLLCWRRLFRKEKLVFSYTKISVGDAELDACIFAASGQHFLQRCDAFAPGFDGGDVMALRVQQHSLRVIDLCNGGVTLQRAALILHDQSLKDFLCAAREIQCRCVIGGLRGGFCCRCLYKAQIPTRIQIGKVLRGELFKDADGFLQIGEAFGEVVGFDLHAPDIH